MISKLLVITDGCRLYNIKETDNNSHFSLGSTAQPKLFVMSRILAEYFSFSLKRDNSATSNISRFFFQPSVFFSYCRLGVYTHGRIKTTAAPGAVATILSLSTDITVHFCRAMLCISVAYAVMRCLCLCVRHVRELRQN